MNPFFTFLFMSILFFLLSTSALSVDCQDGDERACGYDNVGVCKSGTQYCENGFWSMCYGTKGPEIEVCDDQKDNDCDGETDEQCECTDSETRPCGPDNEHGVCQRGTETCVDGTWDVCEGAVFPFPTELCGQDGFGNNEDDNCNGQIDEGCQTKTPTAPVIDCFNGLQDFGEQGVDCGGPCTEPCEQQENTDVDNDGLTYAQEIALGSSPTNPDTDADGILDGQDSLPLCPDRVCQASFGETSKNCEDCKNPSQLPMYLFVGLLILILIAVWYFYTHMKHTVKLKKKTLGTAPDPQPPFDPNRYNTLTGKTKKKTSSKIDDQLEKSFGKVDTYLKK